LLGAFSTLDSGMPLWWRVGVGSLVGFFFGCVFGDPQVEGLGLLLRP
jgi:hypothetical protein